MTDHPTTQPVCQDAAAASVDRLLRLTPDSWADVPENLTALENDALKALTAAGFVERRFVFSLKLPGEEQFQRVEVELTGERGLELALQSVLQDLWVRFREQWQRLRRECAEPIKPIVILERDQWRLSACGRQAREDLKRGEQTPIDFALRRGFFDGRPRLLPNGRITRREPVHGYGRLVRLENATTKPLAVSVTAFPAAEELAAALARVFAANQPAPAPPAPPAEQPAPAAPTVPPPPWTANHDRDRKAYELAKRGKTWKEVVVAINKMAKQRGWDGWETEEAAYMAVQRFVARNQLPPLPPRKAGRKRRV